MVILCWHPLIIVHPSFPFSVLWGLSFIDYMQRLGYFAFWIPLGFDEWDKMTEYQRWDGDILPSCSPSVSALLYDSGRIPLWPKLLWVPCLPHSRSHMALIILFPLSSGLEMEIGMGNNCRHSVIFIYNAGKTKLVRCRSLTIIFDMVSMGTDGLDLKQQTLQVSFWRGSFCCSRILLFVSLPFFLS